jgi:hypothetical protein
MHSKVAGFGDDLCKLFEVLLVFLVEAVLDSTIDVNNGNNLGKSIVISFIVLKPLLQILLFPQSRKPNKKIEAKQKREQENSPFHLAKSVLQSQKHSQHHKQCVLGTSPHQLLVG